MADEQLRVDEQLRKEVVDMWKGDQVLWDSVGKSMQLVFRDIERLYDRIKALEENQNE